MKEIVLYDFIGRIVVWLSAGIGFLFIISALVSLILTRILKIRNEWKLFVDFAFNREQFKKWRDNHPKSSL